MIKKIFSTLLLTLVFFGFAFGALAQEETATAPALQKKWFCFEESRAGGHTVGLKVKANGSADERPLPNHDTYIIECISTDAGQICTSANDAIDQQIYGQSNRQVLANKIGYKFEGLKTVDGKTVTQPLKSDVGGNLPELRWQDSTPQSHTRRWLGLNLFETLPTVEMGQGGEQLGTFDFETAQKKCASFAWDPYGRVFDSNTLEPLKGMSVTLLKERENGIFSYVNPYDPEDVPGGALINPIVTQEDGQFTFVVPDGTYKLSVQGAGYTFPNKSTVNANYSTLYSDIYPSQTGVEIVQAGAIQHRDIPVDAVGQSQVNPIKIMEYSYQSDLVSSVIIEGRVSHPLAVINLYSVIPNAANPEVTTRYRLISTVTANKLGVFSATVDQSIFDTEVKETFGEVEATKSNLTVGAVKTNLLDKAIVFFRNLLVRGVSAQTTTSSTIKLEPIPTYLEGFAYDAQGEVIPNAKIGIYLNFSAKPYYETTADEKGYFKISSDFIPFMPYKLRYSSPAGALVTVSTVKFLADNDGYIKENKVDPFTPIYADPKVNQQVQRALTATASPSQVSVTPATQASSPNMAYVGLLIFIVMLLGATGALAFFLVKRNRTPQF